MDNLMLERFSELGEEELTNVDGGGPQSYAPRPEGDGYPYETKEPSEKELAILGAIITGAAFIPATATAATLVGVTIAVGTLIDAFR